MSKEFNYLTLGGITADITFADENEKDGGKKIPKFSLVAYTGASVNPGWGCPVIIDLAGVRIPKQRIPVRFAHDYEKGVGHTEKITVENGKIVCEGVISRETEYARDVVSSSANGFPWQVSIGCPVHKHEVIEEGQSVKVNGQTFKGRCYVLRDVTLKEVSFVDLGADANTSANVKLSYVSEPNNGELAMPKSKNDTDAALQDNNDASQSGDKEPDNKKVNLTGDGADNKPAPEKPENKSAPAVHLTAEQQLAENRRIDAITRYGGGRDLALEAQAIDEGWSFGKFQAELNKAGMPSGESIQPRGDVRESDKVIMEAVALKMTGSNSAFLEKHYKPDVLEIADKLSGIGLQEFVEISCGNNRMPKYRRDPYGWLQAAFSSMTLPGILSNVVNKTLLEGFESITDEWRKIVSFGTTNDFKQYTRYRLTGDFKFQPVGPGGELKHTTVSEEQFQNQVDTHGIMFALTRQDIINDDLGALTSLPKQIGMGAAYALNDAIWELLISNKNSFFSAGHKNLLTGKTLDVAGFTAAKNMFKLQEYAKGRPLGLSLKYLLVPTSLETQAKILIDSPVLDGGTTLTGNINPHFHYCEVISTPYLQSSAYNGSSETSWYLFAAPNQLSAFEVAFLNGKQQPTVERADADFNTLGIQFRGYMDFGVAAQDYRAALKVTA